MDGMVSEVSRALRRVRPRRPPARESGRAASVSTNRPPWAVEAAPLSDPTGTEASLPPDFLVGGYDQT
jgi:hypothetical protein